MIDETRTNSLSFGSNGSTFYQKGNRIYINRHMGVEEKLPIFIKIIPESFQQHKAIKIGNITMELVSYLRLNAESKDEK